MVSDDATYMSPGPLSLQPHLHSQPTEEKGVWGLEREVHTAGEKWGYAGFVQRQHLQA